MLDIVWLALLFPALGFLYCGLIGWRMAPRSCGLVAPAMVGLSFLTGLVVLSTLISLPADQRHYTSALYTWIGLGDLRVPMALLVDPLSVTMLLIVTGVGFLIHGYSVGYMAGDPGYGRFFAYMNLFILAMLTLVLANNLVLLMVGWGGVGLASYLLIAFWFERPEAADAGLKAFVVNAIGDLGLLVAAFLIFLNWRAVDYDTVLLEATVNQPVGGGLVTAITLLLLLAAVAKSAQLPLHTWLPDAMAGPTPVSALIHAATMVTAGVYLVARTHPLFQLAPLSLSLVASIGAVTALFAATIGLTQFNIKRVLAYSTISQLGFMFLALGVGAFSAGIFHLVTHAFFKATLFLAAGAVIHALHGEEDLRLMGGLRQRLPGVYWWFLFGALALAGFPLFSGFFSKDEIIVAAFTSRYGNGLLGTLALVTALLTGLYIFRAFFLAFHGSPAPPGAHGHLQRAGFVMMGPLAVLAILAAVGGYVQFPIQALETFLHPVFAYRLGGEDPASPLAPAIVALSTAVGLVGIALAAALYSRPSDVPKRLAAGFAPIYALLVNKYYVDALYDALLVVPARWLGGVLAAVVDPQWIDGLVRGVGVAVRHSAEGLSLLETGYVRGYALAILAGIVVILAFVLGGLV